MAAKVKQKKKIVQGAWISIEDHELLRSEARRLGLRSSTAVASQILTGHCQQKRLEDAQEIVRKSKKGVKHGKGQTRSSGVRTGNSEKAKK